MKNQHKKYFLFYSITLIVFFIFLSDIELKCQSISYVFNADGKLLKIEGLKKDYPLIKNGILKKNKTELVYKVIDSDNSLKEKFELVFNKYLQAYKNLADTNYINDLKCCGIISTGIDSLREIYCYYISVLNEEFNYVTNLSDFGIIVDTSKKDIATNYKKVKDNLFDSLYQLNITSFSTKGSYPLKYDGKEWKYTIELSEIKKFLNEKEKKVDVQYELRFIKPIARFVSANKNAIIKTKKGYLSFTESFTKFEKSLKPLMNNIQTSIGKGDPCQTINMGIEAVLKESEDYFKKQRCNIFLKNKDWVKLWLWYSEGIPSLSPLQPQELQQVKDVDSIEIELQALSEKKKSILSVMAQKQKGCDSCLGNLPDTIYKIEKLINKLSNEILKSKSKNEKISKANEKIKNENNELSLKDEFLYSGICSFNLSKRNFNSGNLFVREHNADNAFAPMSLQRDNYDQNTEIRIYIENVKKNVEILQRAFSVKDISPVDTELNSALTELNGSLSSYYIKNRSTFDEANCTIKVSEFKDLKNKILFYSKMFEKFFNDEFDFYQLESKDPFRKTQDTVGLKDNPGITSYVNMYTINPGKKDSIHFKYRVNKLYLIWPAAGFVYSFAEDPEITINSDGSLTSKYYSGLNFIAGLKIHPFRTAVMDPDFLFSSNRRPFFDYRKIYLFMGFDVLNITKEYFLGGGVDLWSGLSLTCGFHLIRKNQQYYENGVVQSKEYLDWKNLYLGINLDLTLAVKLVQFFAFK